MNRFAPITQDILARKGEARPWREADGVTTRMPLAWQSPRPVPPCAAEVPSEQKERGEAAMHRCAVRISQRDYERLGILAVKQGKTRQSLLQEAVGRLFTGMSEEFGSSCRCLAAANSDRG